jgi:hypothetical protein
LEAETVKTFWIFSVVVLLSLGIGPRWSHGSPISGNESPKNETLIPEDGHVVCETPASRHFVAIAGSVITASTLGAVATIYFACKRNYK